MKNSILFFLGLLLPALSFAAETEFFRDAQFNCTCIISRPDNVTYSVEDSATVNFYRENRQVDITTAQSGLEASGTYVQFGPILRFAGDCDTEGKGRSVLNLWVNFSFKDDCAGFVFDCRGFRRFER